MSDLMTTAVELMMLGMGMVFVFLVALILAVHSMSFLLNKKSEPDATLGSPSTTTSVSSQSQVQDDTLRKVISEAIRQHRAKK